MIKPISFFRLSIFLTAVIPFVASSAPSADLRAAQECGRLLSPKVRAAFSQWVWDSDGTRAKSLSEIAPNTFYILKKDVSFDDESVARTLKTLSEDDPLGINISNHQVGIGTRNEGGLETISSTMFVPDFITRGDLDRLVAPSIQKGVISTVEKLSSELVRATGRELDHIELSIRATSDQMGARVTSQSGGNSESGLHIHGERDPLDRKLYVGFTFPIRGQGSRYLEKDIIYQAKEDEILLMGIEVPHGSPQRTNPELIVVGTVWLGARK